MMSKEKYLVAIDLDGTLLRDDKTISSTTKNYLRKFENEGNIVVITSGRA
ncbi:MAG TPA: Cof-type HAD-IIB family hydrolase, partial [Firmicutes bacterium]|nr:Cof-type HAD-IIB family hydrolase [Bacillota bacterium]